MTLAMPPLELFVIHMLAPVMVNRRTKFYVSSFAHYKDRESNPKFTKWGGFMLLGSLKVTEAGPLYTPDTTSC